MRTRLSSSPYFDTTTTDYAAVAYKAGFPVQARELNEAQRIQQTQLTRLADHVFKPNSKISGPGVQLATAEFINCSTTVALTEGLIATNSSNGLSFRIVKVINTSDLSKKTLVVNYLNSGTSGEVFRAAAGSVFTIADVQDGIITVSDCGVDTIATLLPTVFYTNSGFYEFSDQSGILLGLPYNEAGVKVGLVVSEQIVNATQDQELLDTAAGYTNVSMPGADRVKVSGQLVSMSTSTDESFLNGVFIRLAEFDQFNTLVYLLDRTDYSSIMETMAERMYDANGHFTVNQPTLSILNHKKYGNDDATGVYLSGDKDLVVAAVSPVKAYVNGFLAQTISQRFVPVRRGIDTTAGLDFSSSFASCGMLKVSAFLVGLNAYNKIPQGRHKLYSADQTKDLGTIFVEYLDFNESLEAGISNQLKVGTLYFSNLIINQDNVSHLFKDAVIVTGSTYYLEKGPIIVPTNPDGTPNFAKSSILTVSRTSKSADWITYGAHRPNMIDVLQESGAVVKTFDGGITCNRIERVVLVNDHDNVYKASAPTGSSFTYDGLTKNQTDGYYYATGGLVDASLNTLMIGHTTPAKVLVVNATTLTVEVVGGDPAVPNAVVYCGVQTESLMPYQKFIMNEMITRPANLNTYMLRPNVYQLEKVELIRSSGTIDVTDQFTVVDKSNDYAVTNCYLVNSRPGGIGLSTDELRIYYSYFELSENGSYVSIDSYTPNLGIVEGFSLDKIKQYVSSEGVEYNRYSTIDFRPVIDQTGYVVKETFMPNLNRLVSGTVINHLPRIDIIGCDTSGQLTVIEGVSNENPVPPLLNQRQLALFSVNIPAGYVDKGFITTAAIDGRRYTMTDIRKVDTRLKNVEYAVMLNATEQRAIDMNIQDSDGNTRFKNGILVDTFTEYTGSDLTHPEFAGSIDRRALEFKPKTYQFSTELVNVVPGTTTPTGVDIIVPAYTEEVAISQPVYTKSVSLNPYYVFANLGNMYLMPQIDTYSDVTYEPAVSVTVDSGVQALTSVTDRLALEWGSWSEVNKTIQSVETRETIKPGWTSISNTTTTQSDQVRVGTKPVVTEVATNYTATSLTDVKLNPYVRPRRVAIVCNGLRPNTAMNFFFGDRKINEFVGSLVIDQAVNEVPSRGSKIKTDSNGYLFAYFDIPSRTFLAGDHKVTVTPANTLEEVNEHSTYASSVYYSAGIDVTKQVVDFNIISPVITNSFVTETRTDLSVNTVTTVVDPLAQSFTPAFDCMITSIDVLFDSVDLKSKSGAWVELVSVENGYPSSKVYGKATIKASDIALAPNWQKIRFNVPVFVEGGVQYAFVIGADSPEFRIKVARLGQLIEGTNMIVQTQPNTGTSFRSQNSKTWTAEQFEDLAFKINIAKFESTSHTFEFVNGDIDNKPRLKSITTNGSSQVLYNTVGALANVGDQFKVVKPFIKVVATKADGITKVPLPGHKVTAVGFEGTITSAIKVSPTTVELNIATVLGNLAQDSILFISGSMSSSITSFGDQQFIQSVTKAVIPTVTYVQQMTAVSVDTVSSVVLDSVQVGTVTSVVGPHSFIGPSSLISTPTITDETNIQFNDSTELLYISTRVRYHTLNISGVFSSNKGQVLEQTMAHTEDGQSPVFSTDVPSKNDIRLPSVGIIDPDWISTPRGIKYRLTIISPNLYIAPVVNAKTFRAMCIQDIITKVNYGTTTMTINAPQHNEITSVTACSHKYVSKTMSLRSDARDLRVIFDVSKPAKTHISVYIKLGYGDNALSSWIEVPNLVDLASISTSSYKDRREVDLTLSKYLPSLFIDSVSPTVDPDVIKAELMAAGTYSETALDAAIAEAQQKIPAPYSSVKLKIVCKSETLSSTPILSNIRMIALT